LRLSGLSHLESKTSGELSLWSAAAGRRFGRSVTKRKPATVSRKNTSKLTNHLIHDKLSTPPERV